MKRVTIITDGACDPNPGVGGWACILRYGHHEKVLTGSAHYTTNNKMELLAAIRGLQALSEKCNVEIITDSQYLTRGMTEWLRGWKKRQWGGVKNADLWQTLDQLNQYHKVKWTWVRGHDGNELNERADVLAVQARQELVRKRTPDELKTEAQKFWKE